MSDQPITPVTEPGTTPPAATEPVATAPSAPPWGEDFDAEKAWTLVQNLRSDKEKLASRQALTDEQKQKLADYDQILESQKTAEQKAQEAALTAQNKAAALLGRAVKAEVKALAGGFADPEDAAAFLDLSKYATEDGDVDTESITSDLAALLIRKPHLGKAVDSRLPKPHAGQGLTDDAGPSLDTQIAEATKKGDHALAIRLKRQRQYASTDQ